MIGFQIIMGLVVIISLLALFDRDLLGDRQRYQQFAAICIAGIVSWAAVILLGMYLAGV
ncbi:MAG TPA: hypothetical protein H9875_08440 [Candidatus Levilactobacillus faecigallinarum]|uniref:Uncharacterized protein n=1 Tax=Candidatus Levilactobacillus faecigallinarum TaxID=2838638 RepID=A0A9D1QV90_9LACO|nr:hypothetical protein [Candidatus Levilactobacillus faecigallinarum]